MIKATLLRSDSQIYVSEPAIEKKDFLGTFKFSSGVWNVALFVTLCKDKGNIQIL